jgi:hypothetical protein
VHGRFHVVKKAQRRQKTKNNTAACLRLLNYLVFFRPAAEWAVSILPWVVSRGRSHGFLWADSIIHRMRGKATQLRLIRQKAIEGVSRRLLKFIGREECKHRHPKSADPTYRRTKSLKHVTKGGAPIPHWKPLRLENVRMEH